VATAAIVREQHGARAFTYESRRGRSIGLDTVRGWSIDHEEVVAAAKNFGDEGAHRRAIEQGDPWIDTEPADA
jgi:hypothetical protein